MKKIAIAVVVLLIFIGGAFWFRMKQYTPEVMVQKLMTSDGDQEQTIMRLNMARGDTMTPMLAALQDEGNPTEARSLLIELLLKKHLRVADDRVVEALAKVLKSPDDSLREKASSTIASLGGEPLQLLLLDSAMDSSPVVRREVYLVFTAGRHDQPEGGVWAKMSEDQKETLMKACRHQMKTETDPELRFFARSVVGRQVAVLCKDARQAIQSANLTEAKELLDKAAALDSENHRLRINQVRRLLAMGDREEAIAKASEIGALFRVPKLSKAPVIDGDPTDSVWDEGLMHDQFYLSTSAWAEKRSEGKSTFFIGHHDGTLYVAARGYEENLDELVIKQRERDSNVYTDDSIELFLDPTCSGQMSGIYQFIINAVGTLQDFYKRDKKQNMVCEHAGKVFHSRGYWGCEFAVKASDLHGQEISSESLWGFNFMRARIGPASEQCAFYPCFGYSWNCHLYPLMIFEDAPPPKQEDVSSTD